MKIKELEKRLKKINSNWEVETNADKIYWDKMYKKSIAINNGIDIRTKGKRKPILIYNKEKDYKIMVEWDYGKGDWIIYNNSGGIIGKEKRKSLTLYKVYSEIIKQGE